MCLAIPTQIVELQEEGMARVRVGESQTFLTASMMLLPEPPQIAQARTEGLLVLTQYTELADLGTYSAVHPVTFTYSPPGASNLPVNIILLPE